LEVTSEGRLAYSAGDQNTGILKTMLQADGLAMLPADRSLFSPGEKVEVYLLSEHGEMREPHLAAAEKSVTTGDKR
jgi:molybdopterin molybdotransferase